MTLSPIISAQGSKLLLEVTIIDNFSYISLIKLKKRFASRFSIGVCPISSIIMRLDFIILLILYSEVFWISAVFSSFMRLVILSKHTLYPFSTAATPKAMDKCFFPMPGVIAVIQTSGTRLNFHPHLHVLLTEGGKTKDGAFHPVKSFNDALIRELFTCEVFSLLLREKLIGLSLVQRILRWQYTGFKVHSKVRAKTNKEAERVGKYMIRPLLSLQRLSFDESEGKVRYQYDKHGKDEEQMDYLEFIARVTSHIPDKGHVMVRYYGLYSNAHRGKKRKAQ